MPTISPREQSLIVAHLSSDHDSIKITILIIFVIFAFLNLVHRTHDDDSNHHFLNVSRIQSICYVIVVSLDFDVL